LVVAKEVDGLACLTGNVPVLLGHSTSLFAGYKDAITFEPRGSGISDE
jgi:hypothetical protein